MLTQADMAASSTQLRHAMAELQSVTRAHAAAEVRLLPRRVGGVDIDGNLGAIRSATPRVAPSRAVAASGLSESSLSEGLSESSFLLLADPPGDGMDGFPFERCG